MRVLVTGGAGFLGRWVVKRFLDDGDSVTAFDNLSNGSEENIVEFMKNKSYNSKFVFVGGDITNANELERAFASFSPDICVHCAAQINVQESLDFPENAFKGNVIGTYNVLEECRKSQKGSKKTKLILIGTCMVYDTAGAASGAGTAISETHSTKPASPYAGSKMAAEELALSYYRGIGLPVVVLRPFNIYGPFQKTNMEGGVVNIFIKRALEGQDLNIFGDGKQTRDLLYVEDCADFIFKAATKDESAGEVINAGTGKDVSINDLAKTINEAVGGKSQIKHVPHHHPQAEIMKLLCDSSKARKMLGWEAKTSLESGIRKTIEWMKTEAKIR